MASDLDLELLALLNRRAAEWATISGSARSAEDRDSDAAVIAAVIRANTGPLTNAHVSLLWRELLTASRSLNSPTRVAYLGPAGTFSELAAMAMFGSSLGKVVCGSIDEVFRATSAGTAHCGVIPIENSTEGMVARSLDLLRASPLTIVAENSMYIEHCLLRRVSDLAAIVAVCAHPQALAQCHEWLSRNLPGIELRPVGSNAEGARLAAADPRLVAIASSRAATEHSLSIVATAIQDEPYNRTRFVVLVDPSSPPVRLGALAALAEASFRTSLIVSVPNHPGVVHDLLLPLKQHGVSMSRLESRPARLAGEWEYYFYIDVEGRAEEPNIAAALGELRHLCTFWKLLGSYPVMAS